MRPKTFPPVVLARAAVRARRRRDAGPGPVRDRLDALAAALAALDGVRLARVVEVPVDRPPWHDSGVELRAGDEVTTFAAGRNVLSRALGIWAPPRSQLWFRLAGAAPVFRGARDTNTFVAERDGRLELASYFPGEWADASGALATGTRGYRRMTGRLVLLVIVWNAGADSSAVLRQIAVDDPDGLAAAELDRRQSQVDPPADWEPHWLIGPTESYRGGDGGHIACHSHGPEAGIIRHPVDYPLGPETRLRWSWRVDELPSELAENTLLTHDYLSIALEFDNGLDLTWHWSAELPPGYSYRCPIPTWRGRETHMVVRTGSDHLGEWVGEERPVLDDYARAIKGPAPGRIVAVWLIAVTAFQRGEGRCAYDGIALTGSPGGEVVQI